MSEHLKSQRTTEWQAPLIYISYVSHRLRTQTTTYFIWRLNTGSIQGRLPSPLAGIKQDEGNCPYKYCLTTAKKADTSTIFQWIVLSIMRYQLMTSNWIFLVFGMAIEKLTGVHIPFKKSDYGLRPTSFDCTSLRLRFNFQSLPNWSFRWRSTHWHCHSISVMARWANQSPSMLSSLAPYKMLRYWVNPKSLRLGSLRSFVFGVVNAFHSVHPIPINFALYRHLSSRQNWLSICIVFV